MDGVERKDREHLRQLFLFSLFLSLSHHSDLPNFHGRKMGEKREERELLVKVETV